MLSQRSKLSWARLRLCRQIVSASAKSSFSPEERAPVWRVLPEDCRKHWSPFKGTAVLERILRQAEEARFEEALVLLGYQADLIQRTLQTGSWTRSHCA